MKTFTEAYFKTLCGRFSQYNPQDVSQAVWAGTGAMVKNDGSRTNRDTFYAAEDRSQTIRVTERFGLPLSAKAIWNPATENAYFTVGLSL